MLCDDCGLKCRSSDECGMYQDLDYDAEKLREENEALEAKIKSLKADLELWKQLSKDRYKRMVDVKLGLKKEKDTSEFLRQEVYRKDAMLARLK